MLSDLLTNVLVGLGLAHWVVIQTQDPECVYYFGPYLREADAEAEKAGYVADLEAEGASGISCEIKQCRAPESLTSTPTEVKLKA